MAESDLAKRFEELAAHLPFPVPEAINPLDGEQATGDRLLDEMVYAFLMWEAGAERADRAFAAIRREFLDHNELRVCLVAEMRSVIGKTYPRSEPRCIALRDALNAIFERCNGLSLTVLAASGKRELRAFFEAIPGIPHYVTARVCLSQDVHIFPLDTRLQRTACEFINDGTIDSSDTPDANAMRIERALRAGEAQRAYAVLEALNSVGLTAGAQNTKGARSRSNPSATGDGS